MQRKRHASKPGAVSPRWQSLRCIPVKNPEAREETNEEGILLTYPVEIKPWFRGILQWFSGNPGIVTRRLQLDALGSQVWQLIDNQKDIRQITALFQQRHQIGAREAELSVTAFLRELGRRGLVAMKAVEPSGDSQGKQPHLVTDQDHVEDKKGIQEMNAPKHKQPEAFVGDEDDQR